MSWIREYPVALPVTLLVAAIAIVGMVGNAANGSATDDWSPARDGKAPTAPYTPPPCLLKPPADMAVEVQKYTTEHGYLPTGQDSHSINDLRADMAKAYHCQHDDTVWRSLRDVVEEWTTVEEDDAAAVAQAKAEMEAARAEREANGTDESGGGGSPAHCSLSFHGVNCSVRIG